MATGRENFAWTIALATALLVTGAPSAAQVAPATNTPATPAPAPAGNDVVGPGELRDFTLNGTVTQRAEPAPIAGTPPPAMQPPAASPPGRAAAAPVVRDTAPVRAPAPSSAGSDLIATTEPVTPPFSGIVTGDTPGFTQSPLAAPAETLPTPLADPDQGKESSWPWLIAALAALLGATYYGWQRRQRSSRNGEAFAGNGAGIAVTPQPRPSPLPATPQPRAAAPAPPRPVPAIAPRAAQPPPRQSPAPTPPRAPVPGGIVAAGLKPKLDFEIHPIRAEADGARGAALLFDVIVVNSGSAPARDVLVEAQLINAGPKQDEQIGRFFREPVGTGERLPVIPPMGRISIKTRLTIPGDQMVPIEVEGRKLFVPLVAFNALYRWSGGEGQDSASFLVGRGDGGGKMAPFRLDQGARSWSGLDSRQHSAGLQRA